MDCFLITYCIWSRESEIEETNHLVQDVIRRNGYRLSISFQEIVEELNQLKEEIKDETSELFEEEIKELEIFKSPSGKDMYKFNMGGKEKFIAVDDFNSLDSKLKEFHCYYYDRYNKFYTDYIYASRLNNDSINDSNHGQIDLIGSTKTITRTRIIIPKDEDVRKWQLNLEKLDNELATSLHQIESLKKDILMEAVEHLFVDHEYRYIVVSNLDNTWSDLVRNRLQINELKREISEFIA